MPSELQKMRRQAAVVRWFVTGGTALLTGLLTYWLKELGMTRFRGNLLGFIGLGTLIVLGCYAANRAYYCWRAARDGHEPAHR